MPSNSIIPYCLFQRPQLLSSPGSCSQAPWCAVQLIKHMSCAWQCFLQDDGGLGTQGGYVTLQSLPDACGATVRQSSPRYGKAEGPCPGTTGTASWLPAFGNSRQAVGAFHQSPGSYCTQTIRIRVNRVDNVVRDDIQFFSQSLFPAKFKHDKAHYISASTLSLWNKKAWMFPKSHSRLEELFIKFLANWLFQSD